MKNEFDPTRRSFLTAGSAALALSSLAATQAAAQSANTTATTTTHTKERRMLGALEVSSIGLGVQNMHRTFHSIVPNRSDMIDLIRAAYDKGVTFFDCAEVYGPYVCEEILGEAMAPFRDKIEVTTKFGFDLDPDTGAFLGVTSRPERIRAAVEGSLKRLNTDRVELLYQHRVDPEVPIEDVAGTVKDLMDEGKVLHWGLSEAGPKTLRKAHEILPVAAVQNEYSMLYRGVEDDILPLTKELGIGFVPFSPLGYGFLTGAVDMQTTFAPSDFRAMTSRMDTENREVNMALVEIAQDWAKRKNVKPGQIALAWLQAQGENVVPIPGTTQMSHLRDNIAAAQVSFSDAELAELNTAVRSIEVRGNRAPKMVMDWNGVEAPDA
ncbi:MAG: aldo/keto reductase [Pseudomonadota bacterium]